MKEKNSGIEKRKIGISIKSILLILVVIACAIFVIFSKNVDQTSEATKLELLRSMKYTQVNNENGIIDNCDYVRFNAFFTRDLNNDGNAEMLLGTCREVGYTDTLYMDLNVLTEGYLENGVIEIHSSNFNYSMNMVKDNVLKYNYISNNVKKIQLNKINAGTQKLILGDVLASIGNNINNYSNISTITLKGTHVTDDGQTKTQINKTIKLTVDWHGTTKASISASSVYYNFEEFDSDTISFNFYAYESKKQLLLQENFSTIEIPNLNGYAPLEVKCTNSNVEFNYDEETQKLTIKRTSTINENGILTSTLAYSNSYNVVVKYPQEAYDQISSYTTLKFPIETKFIGYNNPNDEFENPHISNIAKANLSVIFREKPKGNIYNFNVYIKDKTHVSRPNYRYVISKQDILNAYDSVDPVENKKYVIGWHASRGSEGDVSSLIMSETKKDGEKYGDKIDNIIIDDYTINTGIYFKDATKMLGESGTISVYNDDTNELIKTFTKEDWDTYTNEAPFKYETPVKHIRVETTAANVNSSLNVYHTKELNIEKIKEDYEKQQVEEMQLLTTHLTGVCNIVGQDAGKLNDTDSAYLVSEVSNAEISISNKKFITQDTYNNQKIYIDAKAIQLGASKWQNGMFVVELPAEILNINVNSVVTDKENVEVLAYDVQKFEDKYIIKIITQNVEPESYRITIDANMVPDPRVPNCSDYIKLYAYNEICNKYYNTIEDIYDININNNTKDVVGTDSEALSFLSPTGLITMETITNYDNEKQDEITVAPNIAELNNKQKEATINLELSNNYQNSISGIKVLGKIPFEGNTYVLNSNDMNSKFSTTMTNKGIKVPEQLKNKITVYYSENPNPTIDISKSENGWKTLENVDDFSKIKTYLIDFKDKTLNISETYTFSYNINLPENINYNLVSYSDHAVYYDLETEGGKLQLSTEPNKLGLRVVRNFDLQLNKFKKDFEQLKVSGALYEIEYIDPEGNVIKKVATTDSEGNIKLKDLYVGLKYVVKEIKSPINYVLNNDEFKFEIIEDSEGNLKCQTTNSNVVFNEETEVVSITTNDEPKYNLTITKLDRNTNEILSDIRFAINGKVYTTDSQGQILLERLQQNVEYKVLELKADKYYLLSEITFKLVKDNNGNLKIESDNEEFRNATITNTDVEDLINVELNLSNDKIPTYNLEVLKVEKNTSDTLKPLKGAKFKLECQDIEKENYYETDANGKINVENLYQYVEGKYITGTYVLQELEAPQGYANNGERISFRVTKNAEGNLVAEVDDEANIETIKEIQVDGNTVRIIIENQALLQISKIDSETGKALANAKFIIYELDEKYSVIDFAKDVNGNYVGQLNENNEYIVAIDENGVASLPLRKGIYKAVEVEFPEGYEDDVKDTFFSINIEEKEEVIETVSEIHYIEDLVNIAQNIKYTSFSKTKFKLMRSLDFNDSYCYRSSYSTAYGDINGNGTSESIKVELTTGSGFVGIGSDENPFSGIFDGQGYEIKNLYIQRGASYVSGNINYMGLFSVVRNGTIKNLKVSGNVQAVDAAMIVSHLYDSVLDNCSASGNVSSSAYRTYTTGGGLVARAENSIISNCRSLKDLYVKADLRGGIVARVETSGKIINCCNEISFIEDDGGSSYSNGGIVGEVQGSTSNIIQIYNCYNLGSINISNKGGGIIGGAYGQCNIANCYNSGDISGYNPKGGIVGYFSGSVLYLTNCYNTGEIAGGTIGGIVGEVYGSTSGYIKVTDCYNVGNIVGSTAGGIIGYLSYSIGEISNFYNIGNVIGSYKAGAIVGDTGNTVKDSYYLESIRIEGSTITSVGTRVSSDYMKSREFYDKLNINKSWKYRKNYYPALDFGPETKVLNVQNLVIENTLKRFNITTEIGKNSENQNIGGTITGIYNDEFKEANNIKYVENVKYNLNSQKEIKIIPDSGYEISNIIINDELVKFEKNENGEVIIPSEYFQKVKEDKHITVAFEKINNLIITKVDEDDNNVKLAGAKFNVDIPGPNDLNDFIGEIQHGSNSTTTHHFEKNGEKYVSTNTGISNSVSNSYFPIDLRDYPNKNFILNINASISSESGCDYGYARITNSEIVPAYTDTTGEIMKIGGTSVSTQTYSKTLQGGNLYYLHIGYRKDGSVNSGDDKFTINSINLTSSETLNRTIEIETNEEGMASVVIPVDTECVITEIFAPKGYQLDSTPRNVTILSGEIKELTFTNKKIPKDENVKITKVDADDNNIKLEGVEFEINPKISDVLGTLTANGTYAFEENNGVYTPNNKGINNSTAHSYIKIDLTGKTGKFNLVVNAQVSSENNCDFGFAAVTENVTAPTFSTNSNITGQFIRISGTSNTPNDYNYNLEGGKVYYLHLAYLKNGGGNLGNDIFTVNSVRVEGVNPIRIKTNNEGIAKTSLEPGEYIIKEIKTAEGYILNEKSQSIAIVDGNNEITINNTIKKFNITTKIERTPTQTVDGGTISGKNEQPYEEVRYSQTSTKDILIDPNSGYKIVSIKVNGKAIDFVPDENGNVLLDKFNDMKEDKEVVVKFEPIYESNFTLVKQDHVTKQPLEGIQFEIYYLSVGNDFAKDRNGFYVGEKDANGRYFVTTDSNGEVKLSLPTGLYKAVEVKGANGYVLPEKEEDRTIYFRVLAKADIEINYIEDLIALSNNVMMGNNYSGKVIGLTKDLDFNNPKSYRNANDTTTYGDYNGNGTVETIKDELTNKSSKGFNPIGGNPSTPFSGKFNGNCFEIKNIYINSSYASLFTYILNGELSNLKLTNANITNSSCGGGFAYYCTNSKIYNCGIDGIVKSSTNSPTGGIAYSTNSSEIISCYNNADIRSVYSAGISSYMSNSLIKNCYNTGTITSTGPTGGISYSVTNCTIIDSYNKGDINGKGCTGGVACNIYDSKIQNSYNTGKVTDTNSPAGGFAYYISNCKVYDCYNTGDVSGCYGSSGISNSIYNSNIEGCYNKGNLLCLNSGTAGIAYNISSSTIKSCYNEGNGTSQTYVAVGIGLSISNSTIESCYNKGKLESLNNSAAGIGGWVTDSTFRECYNTGNINSETSNTGDTYGSAGFAISFKNSIAEKCFNEGIITSKYNGAGFALRSEGTNLENCYNKGTINTNSYAGGIVYISLDSEFKNLYNKGKIISNGPNAGIMYSASNCTLENCANMAIVKANAPAGGVVYTATNSNIVKCYNIGEVYGPSCAGGVVYTSSNCLIQDCYNTSNVYSNVPAGGVVYSAYNNTIINNCYNTGDVYANYCVGGILEYSDSNSFINNCYNAGKLIICDSSTANSIGGVSYYGSINNYKNTYYLNTTALSGIYDKSDISEVTDAKTASQMLSKSFVNQLNSNKDLIETTIPLSNWKYNENGYPVLDYEIEIYEYNTSTKQEENTTGNTSTENTTDADFEINYIEDLIDLSNNVTNGNTYEGKKIVLTRNLDFKDVNSYRNPNDKTTYGDYDGNGIVEKISKELTNATAKGFKPIGGTPDKAFSGTFDGNGFEIKNLYINTNYAALFTYILDGKLLNLKLTNVNIINSSCGAGFAYYATNSKIYNCGIDGVLSSSSNAPTAGIVYTTKDSEIKDCYNNAAISGVCTAGISSNLTNTLIENCYNKGSLRSTGPIGGIGYSISNCTIRNCYNEGSVSGKGGSGGIVGSISNSVIENSYNTGAIVDTSSLAGGLAYNISNCEIYNCYNTGDVTGKSISGGIGSSISNSIIKDSYNTGNITDNSGPAGGLAYSISSCEISNFYNTGDVFSNSGAGGIAQSITKSTLKECYNEGDISSTTNCAAGIGLWITESDFKECYNKGEIISECTTNSNDTTGAAGFAITFTKSTAEKCFNEGNVTSKYHGAGFALRLDNSNLNNCYNKGIINANNYAGGIIYISIDSELKNLYNQGQVVSNAPNAGITYSASNCTIEQCANMAIVKSNAPATGVVFTLSNSNIIKCFNEGKIYGPSCASGVVYTSSNSLIQDCYNIGEVYSNVPAGGVAYTISSTIMNNCYNIGKVSGNYCIGGITYYSDSTSSINNCYNTGELITGSSTTGEPIAGIVYSGTMSTLKDTYYLNTTAKSGIYNAVDLEGNVEAKTETEMKSEDFVNLLNENKSSIETEIPLSDWKYNSEGYPVLDFEIDKYDYNTNIPTNKPDYENVESELGITNSKTAKITVHHYLEGTGPEFEKTPVILAPDEVMIGKENHEYSTSPKLNIENYNLIKDENGEYIIPENASGKYTIEGEHIYYYYNVKPLELIVHHYLEGTEDKLSEDEKYFFNENDHYKTTPSEEVLEAYEVTLVEGTEEKDIIENEVVTYYYKKKEYKITTKVEIPESEKEAGRTENGGTILGEGENPYEIVKHGEDSTKDIIATPIDGYKISSITVNGKVVPFTIQGGVITLDKFEKMTEDKEVIVVFEPIVGKVITHHYIQGTTEKLHDDIINIEKIGGVVNTKPIDIENYKLVSSAGNKDEDGNVVITKETHEGVEEIIYYYQKAYKITTDVIEHQESYKDGTIKEAVKGGSITDEDVVIHEQVVKYEDSVKVIEIKPDEGYEIVKVQVNGKAIDLKAIDENGNLTLPEGFFKDVEEDIHVEVEFRKVSKVIVKHLEKDTETELSDTTEIIGHEGNEFETTEKIIPFYTLVKETTDENGEVKETLKITDENNEAIEPNGTMFSDDITIIYWYEKVDANVIERHIEVNAKGEEKELDFIIHDDDIVASVEISRKEYEDYTSIDVPEEIKQKIEEDGLNVIFVSKDDNKVTVTVNSGNATEVWYYYIKQYNITTEVKTHKETVNGTETEVEGGTISKQYKIDENGKEVEDIYEIVNSRADSTKEIKMVPDDGYRIKSVTINEQEIYIDNMVAEDGSLLLPEAYFVDVQEDYHVVVEFERIPAKVIVKYIDEYTKESILEDKVVEGFVNIEYDEPRAEIEKYIPAEPEPTNAKGKMTEETITITYFYKKQFKVTTDVKEHEETDKDGNKVTIKGGKITGEDEAPLEIVSRGEASTKIIKAEPDSGYRVSKLTINDIQYDFRHMLNDKGILSIPVFENMQEDKHIVVEFERIPTQIIVKHMDEETGEELTNQEIIKGFVNGDYSTNSKEFAGYQLNVNKLPINANGKMTEEAIVVIYYYNKLKIPEENITPEIPEQPIEIPEYIPEYIPEFKPQHNNSTNIENVKTGDNIFGYAVLLLVSIVGIIVIIIGKNKKK